MTALKGVGTWKTVFFGQKWPFSGYFGSKIGENSGFFGVFWHFRGKNRGKSAENRENRGKF